MLGTMKKILVIHNKYRNLGGEDVSVSNEVELLSKYYETRVLYFENSFDNLFFDILGMSINKNFKSIKITEREIKEFSPDIIFIHNLWFKGSLGVLETALKSDKKVFLKVHNFRYKCFSTFLIKRHFNNRKYSFCEACNTSRPKYSFFNKVYKDSYIKSVLGILYGKKLKKLLSLNNLHKLTLNEFHKKSLTEVLGINSEKISILHNVIKENLVEITPNEKKYILYAGRISKEKGVEELISSYISLNSQNFQLKLIGIGPDLNRLKNKYEDEKSIIFLGEMSNSKTLEYIHSSLAVVTATKMLEGQPTLLCEASALNKPSIFPDFGGISEYFPDDYNLKFKQFNYKDLRSKLELINNYEDMSTIGKEAGVYFRKHFSQERYIENFSKIIRT